MSYRRRDIYVNKVTGHLHQVVTDGNTLTIDGVVLPIPNVFYARIAADGRGVVWVIYSGDGVTLLRNGVQMQHYPGEYGAGWSGVRPLADGVEVYLQGGHKGDGTCIVSVYAPDGTLVRTYDHAEYSSNGLIDIAPDGTPISANRRSVVIDGVTFSDWVEDGGYTVGLSDGGDSTYGGVALRRPDGTILMAQLGQHIQLPPRLSGGIVAASGFDTPEPAAMPWEPFRRYLPPGLPAPPEPINPLRAELDEVRADLDKTLRELARVDLAYTSLKREYDTQATEMERLREIETAYKRIPGWVKRYYP